MDNKTPDVYLHNILDAIGRIECYVTGVEKEAFLSDDSMVAAWVLFRGLRNRLEVRNARPSNS